MMEYWVHSCFIWLKNNTVHGINKPWIEKTLIQTLKLCVFDHIFLDSLFFLDILNFFKGRGQTPLVFSVNLVFDQPAVKPAGLDRFFP